MNPIRSTESNEHIQGIKDSDGRKEHKANTMARQIFEKYGYKLVKLNNFNDEIVSGYFKRFNDRTDYGVDDLIFKEDIPKDDPFNLLQLKKGRFTDVTYTIDHKSNNFNYIDDLDCGLNSVYIKLMHYHPIKYYLHSYKSSDGEIIKPMENSMRRDQENPNRKRMQKYYNNHQLLGDENRTDYFFYMKYKKIKALNELELISAYLVPAKPLRIQVISILNDILKKGNYNHPITLRKNGLYLNHKIRHALEICNESPKLIKPNILKPPMDLFKPKYKKEIHLRIPEKFLTPHIKFDEEGEIINNTLI